jgi:hypothetical protein
MAADAQFVEPEVVDQDDQEIGFTLLRGHPSLPLPLNRSTSRAGTTLTAGLAGRQRARV